MSSPWHILKLPAASSSVPPLLARFDHSDQGYRILVSDLYNSWSEVLDRPDINTRAFEETTSIDPSEDPSQYAVLLQKIREAISGQSGPFLRLEKLEGKGLKLHIESPLPSPIPPLRWPIYLSPVPQAAMTKDFVLPLLTRTMDQSQQMRALLAVIREKDHAIGKLVDKLDSSGVEVGNVFLNAQGYTTGKRPLSWDQAGRAIKGLAVFDEAALRDEVRRDRRAKLDVLTLLQEATSGGSTGYEEPLSSLGGVAPAASWWWTLKPSRAADSSAATSTRGSRISSRGNATSDQGSETSSDGSETECEDDFERELKPHPNISGRPQRSGPERDSDATESANSDDLDDLVPAIIPPQHGTSHGSKHSGSAGGFPKKLGSIGGKPGKSKKETEAEKRRPLIPSGYVTGQSAENHVANPAESQDYLEGRMDVPAALKPSKLPSRLGRIGGPAGLPMATNVALGGLAQSPPASKPDESRSVKIEGSPTMDEAPVHESTDRHFRGHTSLERTSKPSEPLACSSSDKADLRREELKRQVRQSSNAQKKKRKF